MNLDMIVPYDLDNPLTPVAVKSQNAVTTEQNNKQTKDEREVKKKGREVGRKEEKKNGLSINTRCGP